MKRIGDRLRMAWEEYRRLHPTLDGDEVTIKSFERAHGISNGQLKRAMSGTDIRSSYLARIIDALDADANFVVLGAGESPLRSVPPEAPSTTRALVASIIRHTPGHDARALATLCEESHKGMEEATEEDWMRRYFEIRQLIEEFDRLHEIDGGDGDDDES